MKTESLSLISARDALPLETLVAYPDNAARGVMQISHGMCEQKATARLRWRATIWGISEKTAQMRWWTICIR